MILTTATILLYLVALILTVTTLWPFPQFVWVLIIVVIPFVMLIYFGLVFIISDTINEGPVRPPAKELSFTEGLLAVVSYVGLSGWLWLRWRNPIAPSARILGPAIIATLIILIIIIVIWVAPNDRIF